jgi:hypothetical protein
VQPAVELAGSTRRDLRRDRLGVALVWLVVAWTVLPRTIQSLTAPKMRGEVGVEGVAASTAAALSTTLLTLAVLGFCCVIVLDSWDRRHHASVWELGAVLAPWGYLLVRDLFVGSTPRMGSLVYGAVAVALWRLPLDRRILATLGYAVGTSAALAVTMGVVTPDAGVFRTDIGSMVTDDKAVLPWGLLVGFFSHSNTLGQFLALGLPMVLLVPRRVLRVALIATVLFALLWSASRTSWIAVLLACIGTGLTLVLPRVLRKLAAAAAMTSAVIVASLVPWLSQDPTAFSARGIVWITTREAFGYTPWFGRGSNWFEVVGSTSERLGTAVSSAHSQLLHMLVTGGIVLVVLTLPMLALALVGALRHLDGGSVWAVAYVLALAGCGVTEVVIRFGSAAASLPVVLIPLAALVFGRPDPPVRSPTAGAEDGRTVQSQTQPATTGGGR